MLRTTFLAGSAASLTALVTRPATAAGSRTVTVSVGGASLMTYLPLTIALRNRYFQDEGLDVQVSDFAGGAQSVEALVGGSVDLMCAAYEHTQLMQAKGIGLTAVALLSTSYGVVVALSKAAAARYRTPADLSGMKLGVTAPGSSSALAVQLLIAKAGLPPDAVSTIGIGTGAAAVAAAQSGQLNGISNFDPVISQLTQTGEIVPIVDTRTQKGINYLYGGEILGSAITGKSSYIASQPQIAQSFVNAIVRALHWLRTASADAVVATVPPEFYGQARDLYKTSFTSSRALFSPDGRFSLAAATHLNTVLTSYGTLAGQHIDLPKTFDNTFAAVANQRYH
jgi:NitT/TauT family transport system substrate-binding protein